MSAEPPPPDPADPARARALERDRAAGLFIVVIAFCAALTISWWAKRAAAPETSEPPAPPSADGLAGFPNAIDPLQALEIARALTQRKLFRGLVAVGVKSDGLLDLAQPGGRARFAFSSRPGEGPQPPRPTGTLPKNTYCGRQNVHLGHDGIGADPDQARHPCSAAVEDPLPDPRCGTKDVWQHAITRGAPADRRAHVEYYRSRVGPAWRFEIPGTEHSFSVYGDCARELAASDAEGSVP